MNSKDGQRANTEVMQAVNLVLEDRMKPVIY